MNQIPLPPLANNQPWSRKTFLHLIQGAQQVREHSFIRRATLQWLAAYPGDLAVQLHQARASSRLGYTRQALQQTREICQLDPEYLPAQRFLAQIDTRSKNLIARGNITALSGASAKSQGSSEPAWGSQLHQVRQALKSEQIEKALQQIQQILGSEPPTSLAAITHLQVLSADPDTPIMALQTLAQHYQQEWPGCLLFSLILAHTYLETGQSEKGVDLLHQASTQDNAGQVVTRLWGIHHPYQSLWPEHLQAHLDLQVPAAVSALFGWNQLPVRDPQPPPLLKETSHIKTPPAQKQKPISEEQQASASPQEPGLSSPPESLKSIQEELKKVAQGLGKPQIARTDGRFPVYVIFSTKRGLEHKYGPKTTRMLKEEMRRLSHEIREKPGWAAVTIFADDAQDMAEFGLKPVSAQDPWALKLALVDLDTAFAKKGLMIGAVLIVGDDKIVPMHRLPNPLDDVDAEVPSDNPYATRDENYFIPEWPVGRLPGGKGPDPGLLLSALRSITHSHQNQNGVPKSWWKTLLEYLMSLFNAPPRHQSFGYAAEAWQKASEKIFALINEERQQLITSPPYGKDTELPLTQNQLGYFNLHGVEDNSPWYGQRNFAIPAQGPDYPVALQPEDLRAPALTPKIVFTEACYGAHFLDRALEDSILLTLLSSGAQAVVGSTVTSYGSVTGSLIAADLLAHSFWKHLKDGHPSGQALQQAKISLAQKMHRRQGYLDGEDQKTLISFVLCGDPLASIKNTRPNELERVYRAKSAPPSVKTVCDQCGKTEAVTPEVLQKVKKIVKTYLPGMENAQLTLSEEHQTCQGENHTCFTSQFGEKTLPRSEPGRKVVTLTKEIKTNRNGSKSIHRHYARLTLNEQGKIVKLAVSR